MARLYFSVLLLCIVQAAASQLPLLRWAKSFNAPSTSFYRDHSNGRTVGVDQQGNVYSAGLFQRTVDFDPGPAVYHMTGGGYLEFGIYISKLDSNGNFIWAKQIPVLVEFGDIELKIDRNGNVVLASDLRHPADMDPGPGVQMMTPIGAMDAFVIKLDPNGNLIWAKQFGGPGDTVPHSNVLDIDKDNNVIVCGGFNRTVDFDPGPNTFNLTSTAHIQSYIAKLSSNGDFIWAFQFGNSPVTYSGASILDVKCDKQGNIFTIGRYAGTCDFDPGPAMYGLSSNSIGDGFISKLDPNGNFVWVKQIANAPNEHNRFVHPRGIDIDGMNNIVATGFYTGTFDFDPGPGYQSFSSNGGTYDLFVLKLNANGNFIWTKFITNNESESGNDVVVDTDNNIYVVGTFGRSADFDPGPGVHIINNPYYGADALVKLSPNGDFIYAAPFQSIYYGSSLFRRMEIDAAKNIYVTGYVAGTVDFDPGPNVFPLSGSSDHSPYVVKLGPCITPTRSTLNISSCNSYTLNNETFDSSGTFTQTIQNATGCDSIITLNLTINKKFTHQTKTICKGDFFFAGGANQNTSGTYTDSLKTVLGCDSIVTTQLIVNPIPVPNLGPDKDLCNNSQLKITPGSFDSYIWQDMSTDSNLTVNAAGVYWVKVTNSFNCTATDSFVVRNMLPIPANFLKEKDSICSYQSLDIISANNYSKYQWSTGATDKKIIVQAPGKYWLNVIDANGCSGSDTLTVYPKQCMSGVYIPTAFTPNKDGKNDLFKALVFGKVLSFKLQVFDRGGQLVFETTDPNKQWDGRNNGKDYTTTMFVWQCFYHIEGQQPGFQKGTVLLIK